MGKVEALPPFRVFASLQPHESVIGVGRVQWGAGKGGKKVLLQLLLTGVFTGAERCSDGGRRRSTGACNDSTGHSGYSAYDRERRDADRRTGDHRQSSHPAGDCKHSANHHRHARTWAYIYKVIRQNTTSPPLTSAILSTVSCT